MKRKWLTLVAAGLVLPLILDGCKGRKPPMEMPEPEALAVDVQMAKNRELVIAETYVGTVSASEEITVYPSASGEVLALNVSTGDRVKAGQMLFKLDDESARLSLRSAQAGLASAQASANQTLGGAQRLKEAQEQQNIDTLNRASETAERTLQDAEENIERGRRKLDDAKEDREDAKDDFEEAKDKYQTAKGYQEDWEDLQGEEPAFSGKNLTEAVALKAESSTTDPVTGVTTYTSGPTEAHLAEARSLLEDIKDDELAATDITAAGLSALEKAKDTAKDTVTARQRAVETAQDSVEDYRRAMEGQMDSQANSEASLASAEANRLVTDGQMIEDTKRVLDAQVNSSAMGVAQAQYALEQYTTESPISGIVEKVNIHLHDTVGPSTAALVVSNKDVLKVTFSVTETVRNNLSVGQVVRIKKDGAKCKGLIIEVGEVLDADTGLFKIEAAVDGSSGLLNGTSVTVKVDSYRDDSGIVIPYDAVYYSNGKPYTYIVDDGKAKKVDIETGMFNKKKIVVVSGLHKGDQVITSWSADLRDGAEVVVGAPEEKSDAGIGVPESQGSEGEMAAPGPQGDEGEKAAPRAPGSVDEKAGQGTPKSEGEKAGESSDKKAKSVEKKTKSENKHLKKSKDKPDKGKAGD